MSNLNWKMENLAHYEWSTGELVWLAPKYRFEALIPYFKSGPWDEEKQTVYKTLGYLSRYRPQYRKAIGLISRLANRIKQRPRRRLIERLRDKKTPSSITIQELKDSYLGLCVYCHKPATTIDHIIPISNGGTNTIDNLVPACSHCNSSKQHKPLIVWLAKLQTT